MVFHLWLTRLRGSGSKSGSKFKGINNVTRLGYIEPASPAEHGPHHYYFWLYGLDAELDLELNLHREQILDAIANHMIEQARLVGVYERTL